MSRYLDARGVAEYLSISRSMVDRLVKQGKLPAPVPLTEKLKRWDKEAIDRVMAGGEYITPQPPITNVADVTREMINDYAANRRLQSKKAARRR